MLPVPSSAAPNHEHHHEQLLPQDTKYCPCCETYVRYLASIDRSYCVECGSEVRLMSEADWGTFQERMEARKPKGGRPRKGSRRQTAAAQHRMSA